MGYTLVCQGELVSSISHLRKLIHHYGCSEHSRAVVAELDGMREYRVVTAKTSDDEHGIEEKQNRKGRRGSLATDDAFFPRSSTRRLGLRITEGKVVQREGRL